MGQSMARPQQSRLGSTRGTRSLRHSARNTGSSSSLLEQRRSSLSPRGQVNGATCPPSTPQATPLLQEYSELPPTPANLTTNSMENSFYLKVDSGNALDMSHFRERSLVSPNFGEPGQGQDEYCFQEEWEGRGKESVVRHQAQTTQHEVTISFSKSKNFSTNPFQASEVDESKPQVGNVLESGGQSSEGYNHKAAYRVGQQKSASRRDSKLSSKNPTGQSSTAKQNKCGGEGHKAGQLWRSTGDHPAPINNASNCYNDYDTELPKTKKVQMSSKMLEIKSKLQTRLHDSSQMATSFSRQSVHSTSHSRSLKSQLRSGSRTLRKTHVPERETSFKTQGKESIISFRQTQQQSKVDRPAEIDDYHHHKTPKKKNQQSKKTESSVSDIPIKAQRRLPKGDHKEKPTTKAAELRGDRRHKGLPHKLGSSSQAVSRGSKLIIF